MKFQKNKISKFPQILYVRRDSTLTGKEWWAVSITPETIPNCLQDSTLVGIYELKEVKTATNKTVLE